MRNIQFVVQKLLIASIVGVGVLLWFVPVGTLFETLLKLPDSGWMRQFVSILVVFAGLLALMPRFRASRRNVLFVPGTHGDVTIQLDSIEKSLVKAFAKMEEVKSISVNVVPTPDDRRVNITAVAIVQKVQGEGTGETAGRIRQYLKEASENLLGVDAVITVDLDVKRTVVKKKSLEKPGQPEFTKAPKALADAHQYIKEGRSGPSSPSGPPAVVKRSKPETREDEVMEATVDVDEEEGLRLDPDWSPGLADSEDGSGKDKD